MFGDNDAHPNDDDHALYSAFVSYSHQDRRAATWLQRRVERYRLPRSLRRSGAPARLKPVFRDRDELSAAPDLSEALRTALRRSGHLIVICTPAAATSEWVGREAAYFREAHNGSGVLTALFQGDSEQAFHPALLVGTHGAPAHPLAADFRPGGDGRRLALLKLIAPLAGVRLDELVQRDAQRRMRQIGLMALAAVLAVTTAATLIIIAMQARAATAREQARGADAMQFQLTDLRRKLEGAGRLDLLAAVNGGVERYYRGQDPRTLSIPALLQRAALLQADGKDDEQRGDYAAAHAKMIEAWRLTAPLLASYPRDLNVIYAHAQSEFFMGLIDWRLGDARNARLRFEHYALLAGRLTAIDSKNPDWQHERAFAASNLGIITLRQTIDPARARAFFNAAGKDFDAVAAEKPGDADIQSEIADNEAWLADVDRVAGDLTAAAAHRKRQRAIIGDLVAQAPRDAKLRVTLVASELGLARIEAARGNYVDAIARLDAAHRFAIDLAAADPDNMAIARQKRAIEIFEAQTWLMMPKHQRPSLAFVGAMLGSCDAEWAKARNDELAALCSLGQVQLYFARGNSADAVRLQAWLAGQPAFGKLGLTERWRVDLKSLLQEVEKTGHRQSVLNAA